MMIPTLLLLSIMASPGIFEQDAKADQPIGLQDAFIEGTVANATAGTNVVIETIKSLVGVAGSDHRIFFNTTTDGTGYFISTVDSNDTTGTDYNIGPYVISIDQTYYKDVVNGSYQTERKIEPAETMTIPEKALEYVDALTGTLEIHIYNKTVDDGYEMEGANVTVAHVDDYPDMPFPNFQITDGNGFLSFENIRAVNTTIEATKEHFNPLSSTTQINYVDIAGSPIVTGAVFTLPEVPWPFTTDPAQGDEDGNISNGILIDFGEKMNEVSITDPSNYRLTDDLQNDLEFVLGTPTEDDDMIRIRPIVPFEYDTNYTLSLFAGLKAFSGSRPLWRTMEVHFTTEKPLAMISGRLIETGTTNPAFGMEITLVDQMVRSGSDGKFQFPVVIPGTHDIVVSNGYLFDETEVEDVEVIRGDVIDLGDIDVSPQAWGSMNVTLLSDGMQLAGGWVKIISSILDDDEFNLTTDAEGVAAFSRVRSGNVNIKVGAPHHNMKVEVVIVPTSGLGEITIDLNEDPLPVTVTLTDEISPGIASISSDLLIQMPEPILFQSLNVSLWKLDKEGARTEEVILSPPQEGTVPDSYLVRVQGDLPLESSFEFIIGEELEALDDGEMILWRELSMEFNTLELPLAYLNGTLLIEGRTLEGIEIEYNGQSGTTDEDGKFNVSIDLDIPMFSGPVTVNLTGMGYQLYSEDIQLGGGQVYQMGTIDLIPNEDWFTIVPASGTMNIEPDTTFNITFGSSILDPVSGFSDIFKLVKDGGSAPISGVHTVANSNLSLIFDPDTDLDDGAGYSIIIDDTLLQKNGLPFFPVGKTLVYRVKPPSIDIDVIQPASEELSETDIDLVVRLSFGYAMNKTMVEGSLTISPTVQGLAVNWLSSSEMTVTGLFIPSTEYTLLVPPGVYGLGDEPLGTQFQLVFTTGTEYGGDHSFNSINMIPEPDTGWETGQTVKISGTVTDSIGYTVVISIGEGDDMKTFTTIVGEDGTWSVDIILPETAMEGKMTVSLGTSDSSSAYSRDYDVEIKDPEDDGGEENGEVYTMYYILGAVVILLLIILVAALYIRSQRRKAEDASDIDYSDVDVDDDWEDNEE